MENNVKKDVYQIVADKILDALDKGVIPWHKPWTADGSTPMNYVSQKPYRGINPLLLFLEAEEKGYTCPYWVTYKQAASKGGSVRKGEAGSLVTFWKKLEIMETDKDTGEKKKKTIPMLRYYKVFNLEQCEGIEWDKPEPRNSGDPIEAADRIYAGYTDSPEVKNGGGAAWYRPATDTIGMPEITAFDSEAHYYVTLFHECIHSTGHDNRLKRNLNGNHGKDTYSREELTAEIGAAMLATMAGINTESIFDNSIAYLNHWKQFIIDDPKAITVAAGKAQKAAEYITGE